MLRQNDVHGLRAAEPERPLGMLACELELPAMNGDHGDRKVILRHLEPVLDRGVVGAGGVLGRELPAPGEELDPGEAPESPSGARLVPLVPLPVLALEQRASLVPLRRRGKGVDDRLRALAHQLLAADGVGEVVCHRREILRRLGLADEPAEDGVHRASASPEHVVVDVVGELERCACVREASLGSRDPRDAAVDDRSERGARRRLAQGLLEQGDRTIFVLDVREKHEDVGSRRADLRVGQQLGRDRVRTRPLPGRLMCACSSERSTMPFLAIVRRGQAERLLGELGRDSRRAAVRRQPRGVVEHPRDPGVRRVRREREMTGAQQRVADDSRETFVNAAPLFAQRLVEDGREQRVREANQPVLALDDMRGNRRFEDADGDARPPEQSLRGRAERRGERERPAGGCRECVDPGAYELLERLGDRERLQRVDVGVEDAGELEREERIPARPFVDAKQRLAREGRAEAVTQESVEGAGAQRSDRHSPDAIGGKRLLDPRRLRLVSEPAREQQEHSIRVQPAERKRKCAGGRRVEPLHVVHRNENRLAFAEELEEAAHRDS
ncbi:MAG: hypothetical protein ACJ74P_02595 [Gaiellaceae bacterium]